MVRIVTSLAFLLIAFAISGCVAPELKDPASIHKRFGGKAPQGNVVTVCHAYECRMKTKVALTDGDIEKLRSIMATGSKSAESERAQAAKAIGWLEERVAPQVGTATDRGYDDFASAGDPSQTDCIDEATNATSYLLVLQANGLLKHNRVVGTATRGFIHGQMMHSTAVLRDDAAQQSYAVDSWIRPNGKPAVVLPLEQWFKKSYSNLDLQG